MPSRKCSNCLKDQDQISMVCHFCALAICTACDNVGCSMKDNHNRTCDEYKRRYICTCTPFPLFVACQTCENARIAKYSCFNCGINVSVAGDAISSVQATCVCNLCFNHFVCSARCHAANMELTHNHGLTCGTFQPVVCGHGVLIDMPTKKCACTACEHGMWSLDCVECTIDSAFSRLDAAEAAQGAAQSAAPSAAPSAAQQ